MDSVLILASQSPRRRELINLVGVPNRAVRADVDESMVTDPDPAVNVVKTAQLKVAEVAARLSVRPAGEKLIIVAADTTVALDGQMLGKPADEADALRMLIALRGRSHHVFTGVSILETATGQEIKGVNTAVVTMRDYSHAEIAAYIATGDPMDKAGAYAIQHPIFKPVAHLSGCFTGVMGLSICHLIQMLAKLGLGDRVDLTAVLEAHKGYSCDLYEQITAMQKP